MTAVAETAWVRGSVRSDASSALALDGVSHEARVLGWAPDGSRLAMAEGDTIFVVSIPGGAVSAVSVSHPGSAVAWRPDGRAFAIEVRDAEGYAAAVREYAIETGAALREMAVTQARHEVRRIAYLDGGAVLAVYVAPDRSYTDSETGCTWDEIELDAPGYGEATTTFFGPQGEAVFAKKRYGFEAVAPDGSGLLRMKEFRDVHFWAGDKYFTFRNPFRIRSANACEMRRLSLHDGGATESIIARFESGVRIHASHAAASVTLIEYEEEVCETRLLELDWTTRETEEMLNVSGALSFVPADNRVSLLPGTVAPGKGVQVCALAFREGGIYVDRKAVRYYWLAFEGHRVYDLDELPGDPYTVTFSPGGEWLVIYAPGGGWRAFEAGAVFG